MKIRSAILATFVLAVMSGASYGATAYYQPFATASDVKCGSDAICAALKYIVVNSYTVNGVTGIAHLEWQTDRVSCTTDYIQPTGTSAGQFCRLITSGVPQIVSTMANLQAMTATQMSSGSVFTLDRFNSDGPEISEPFVWRPVNNLTPNGITIIKPAGDSNCLTHGCLVSGWGTGTTTLFAAGGYADGSHSDYTAIVNAYAALPAGGKFILDCGAITVPSASLSTVFSVPGNTLTIGKARGCATLTVTGTSSPNGPVFKVQNASNVFFEDFSLVGNNTISCGNCVGGILFTQTASATGATQNFGLRNMTMSNFQSDNWIGLDNEGHYPMKNFYIEDNVFQTMAPLGVPNCRDLTNVGVACDRIMLQGQGIDLAGTVSDVWVRGNYDDATYAKRFLSVWGGVSNVYAENNTVIGAGSQTTGSAGGYAMMSYDNSSYIGIGGTPPTNIWFVNNTIKNARTSGIYHKQTAEAHDIGNYVSGQTDTDHSSIATGGIAWLGSSGTIIGNHLVDNFYSVNIFGFQNGGTVIASANKVRSSVAGAIGFDIGGSSSSGAAGVLKMSANNVNMTATSGAVNAVRVGSTLVDPLGVLTVDGDSYTSSKNNVFSVLANADGLTAILTDVLISGSFDNYGLYAAGITSRLEIANVSIDGALDTGGGVGATFSGATNIQINGLSFENFSSSAGFALNVSGAQGSMNGVTYKNVTAAKRYYAPDFGTVKPTFSADLGTFVQNLNPVEAGTTPKYLVKGWSNTDGSTTWNDNRVLTGN